jgi:hypothetical protein
MPGYSHLKIDQNSHFWNKLLIGQIKQTHLANMKNRIIQIAQKFCLVLLNHGDWVTIAN